MDIMSTKSANKLLRVGNLAPEVKESDLTTFFNLETNEYHQLTIKAALSNVTGEPENYAIISVDESEHANLLKLNGTDLHGRNITMQEIANEPKNTYAMVSKNTQRSTKITRYVEIDTTTCRNCYEVPATAQVVYAVDNAFHRDTTKRMYALIGQNAGIYKLETQNIEFYENTQFLTHLGNNIATVTIKTETTYISEDGRLIKERKRENNDLLITLYQANTDKFKDITDEQIYDKIMAMGIGKIKKAVTPQKYRDSELLNGNKFFVLANVKKDEIDKIPHAFDFWDKAGALRMWLNFQGKKRKCKFCSKFHEEATCPLEEKIRQLEKERDEIKVEFNNTLPSKTYSDSTLRRVCQNSLASDVDAMSGGSTGNILNAIEIDKDNREIKNILIVAGQNELHRKMEPEEFIWTLKKTMKDLHNSRKRNT